MAQHADTLCLNHSGICCDIVTLKDEVKTIREKELPTIKDAITDLKIFIAKVTGGAFVALVIVEKVFLR
jgi:hypothetical protein